MGSAWGGLGYDVGKVVACEREKHMHALESGKYVRLDIWAEDAKNREKWKGDDMFAFYATMMDEREDGRKEGRAEARSETVKKLLKKMSEEEVAGLLEISVDEVKKLAMVEEKQLSNENSFSL